MLENGRERIETSECGILELKDLLDVESEDEGGMLTGKRTKCRLTHSYKII